MTESACFDRNYRHVYAKLAIDARHGLGTQSISLTKVARYLGRLKSRLSWYFNGFNSLCHFTTKHYCTNKKHSR